MRKLTEEEKDMRDTAFEIVVLAILAAMLITSFLEV